MAADRVAYRACLTRCGLSAVAIDAFIDEGLSDLRQLDLLSKQVLSHTIKSLRTRTAIPGAPGQPPIRGGAVVITAVAENHLKALHAWVRRQLDQDEPFAPSTFAGDVLAEAVTR